MNWVQIIIIIIWGAVLFSLLVALIKGISTSVRNVTRILSKWYQVMFEIHYFDYFKLDVHTVERNSIDGQ